MPTQSNALEAQQTSRPRRRLSAGWWELLLALAAYAVYSFARTQAIGDMDIARRTGQAILDIEAALGLDVEAALNAGMHAVPVLALLSCYFYATTHYLVTPVVLVWLFRRHRPEYGFARTTLLIATAVGFLGHWLLPTAPPRMLPGFEDTMNVWADWGWWVASGSSGVPEGMEGMANPVAAMPSLHVGWAAWCGWYLYRYASRRWIRVAGVLYPLATTTVVVVTANHYVLDAVAGVAVIGVGAGGALLLQRARLRWRPPAAPVVVAPALPAARRPDPSETDVAARAEHRQGHPRPGNAGRGGVGSGSW